MVLVPLSQPASESSQPLLSLESVRFCLKEVSGELARVNGKLDEVLSQVSSLADSLAELSEQESQDFISEEEE